VQAVMPLLKILVIILLILLPFGEILRLNLGYFIYLNPIDVMAVVVALWTAVLYIKNKSYRSSLKGDFFYFPLIGLVSLAVNSYWLKPVELFTASLYLLRWIAYLGVFFAVVQFDEKFRKKIIAFLLADGFIILLFGYFQYFFYQSLQNLSYLGWDRHDYRMYSSFFDPNYLGAFFVLYFLLVAGLLFHNIKKQKRNTAFSYISLLVLIIIAIFLTYSRSALLMLVVAGITFFFLLQRKKYIFYLLGAIVIFVIVISPFFYIENIDLFRLNSSLARLDDIQHALQIYKDHPLFGVGFNAFRYAQIHYHFTQVYFSVPSNAGSGVDTSLLFVLVTTGAIGLVAYCFLWFRLVKNAYIKYKKNIFALIFIASGVGIFVNAFFNNSLFYSEIMFWMWMIAGLMADHT
jgi:O-antigen ligase